MRILKHSWVCLFAVIALAIPVTAAGAASTVYPAGAAGDFSAGDAGWTQESRYGGVCVPALTCPAIVNTLETTGGAGGAGDGFIQTAAGGVLSLGIAASSSGTWQSPAFTFNGVDGQSPDKVTFRLSRLADAADFLAVVGTGAGYSVELVNLDGGEGVTLIGERSLAGASTWSAIPEINVPADLLTIGQKYSVKITTTINTPIGIVPAATVGYDNVILEASTSGTGPGGGGDGNGGGPGGGGSGVVPAVVPPGLAYYKNGKLYIGLKCAKKFKPRCAIRAVALTKKKRGKAMTKAVKVKVKAKKSKRAVLKVKPKFRAKVAKMATVKKRKLIVRVKVKSKKKKATTFRKLRVISR